MKTWANGKIIKGRTPLDSMNFGLHYSGPNAWEGIRSYKQKNGTTKIFKLKEHVDRLFDSAKIVGFEIPYTKAQITEGCRAVVRANGGGDLYLRPIAYTSQDAEPIRPQPQQQINVDIYCFPIPELHGKKDIKTAISNMQRSYPHYDMQAKTAHNYHFLQPCKLECEQRGVDDVFLTDQNGHITEATVSNVFVIKGDVIMTPPNDGSILPGITRRCVAEIIQRAGIMVTKYKKTPILVEKKITRSDLYTADCIILCGTYAEVVNVIEVDGRKLPGSDYYKIIKDEYQLMVRNVDAKGD